LTVTYAGLKIRWDYTGYSMVLHPDGTVTAGYRPMRGIGAAVSGFMAAGPWGIGVLTLIGVVILGLMLWARRRR
jgi:hypothetical protein